MQVHSDTGICGNHPILLVKLIFILFGLSFACTMSFQSALSTMQLSCCLCSYPVSCPVFCQLCHSRSACSCSVRHLVVLSARQLSCQPCSGPVSHVLVCQLVTCPLSHAVVSAIQLLCQLCRYPVIPRCSVAPTGAGV